MKIKLFAGMALISLAANVSFAASDLSLIPLPEKVQRLEGSFRLEPSTRIFTDAASMDTGSYLAGKLETPTGMHFKISGKTTPDETVTDGILLTTNGADASLGAEGYELSVATNRIVIKAPAQAGLFYGVQTLLQLLPTQIYGKETADEGRPIQWTIPCVKITDQPRFQWRGLMLDVSRHFFTKDEVKQLLDAMAMHKINTLHWHLVDDNGWRIEIKKYPKLTEVGAWRKDIGFKLDPKDSTAYGKDGRYGGFYTQDEIREVVAYAEKLHITVIPEIEMPGHSAAALSAYPAFICEGAAPVSTDMGAGVHTGVWCAGKDGSFEFIEDVLTEVFALFPSQYIHIGGDEVPKGNWEKCGLCQERMKKEGLKNEEQLQSYFIRRIEKFVNARGRNLMGWSEILQGGLAQNAAVMDWIGGGREAASQGHDVVMTPTAWCYFDHYQSLDHSAEPLAIGGYLPLEKVYAFEPVPDKLAPEMQKHILGGQGNLWTEYIPNLKHAEYMVFPRLAALAEVTWSPKAARDYPDFTRRVKTDDRRLESMGVRFRVENSFQIGAWTPRQISTNAAPLDWNVTPNVTSAGKAGVRLSYTKGGSGVDIAWVALLENGVEISRDTHAGFAGGEPRKPVYLLDVPAPKPGVTYAVRAQVRGDGGTDSAGMVFWEVNPPSK